MHGLVEKRQKQRSSLSRYRTTNDALHVLIYERGKNRKTRKPRKHLYEGGTPAIVDRDRHNTAVHVRRKTSVDQGKKNTEREREREREKCKFQTGKSILSFTFFFVSLFIFSCRMFVMMTITLDETCRFSAI
jgi:hypothetical protein